MKTRTNISIKKTPSGIGVKEAIIWYIYHHPGAKKPEILASVGRWYPEVEDWWRRRAWSLPPDAEFMQDRPRGWFTPWNCPGHAPGGTMIPKPDWLVHMEENA